MPSRTSPRPAPSPPQASPDQTDTSAWRDPGSSASTPETPVPPESAPASRPVSSARARWNCRSGSRPGARPAASCRAAPASAHRWSAWLPRRRLCAIAARGRGAAPARHDRDARPPTSPQKREYAAHTDRAETGISGRSRHRRAARHRYRAATSRSCETAASAALSPRSFRQDPNQRNSHSSQLPPEENGGGIFVMPPLAGQSLHHPSRLTAKGGSYLRMTHNARSSP